MFSCSFHWLCDKTPAYLTGSYIFSTEKSCAASQISQHFCPGDAITMAARHHLPLLIRNVPISQNTDSKGLTRSGVRHTKFWYLNIFVMDMLSGSFFRCYGNVCLCKTICWIMWIMFIFDRNAVLRYYNVVNFLPNPHSRHPIARPLGRGIGVFCEF